MFKNIFPKEVFSRSFHEKITIILTIPFYIFLLVAIYAGWLTLTKEPLPRFLLLSSIPLLLIFLYLTSYKKIFPQKIGDCLQSLIWILIISAANTYWGQSMRISGPLLFADILLIPFFALLLDSFLPYFIAGIISLGLIIEFLISTPVFTFLSAIELIFKIFAILIIGFASSTLVGRIHSERETWEKLRVAYEELKKLDVAKSEFISIASHQLRTPLTAIKGYISMILEKLYGKPPEKMEKPLENIYLSNERLIKLVNDLLNVSRIEAGRMEMKPEKLSIESIITSITEELKNAAKEKGLYLKWEKPKKPLPKIAIDREKIRQVIMNVVDNAIRYTEKGGVTIKCKAQNEKCKIEISDTGTGLTKYELSKMFESFSRGAAGTRLYTEGVGLGLYIARRLIELHHGKIWAESKGKGKGSTFYIELPIK